MVKNSILKYPNFSRLYFAGLTSEVGSFITETALMLLVFNLSGENKAYLGLTRGVFLLFFTLGNISGGPLGDRFHKKKVLISCDIIRIPLVILLFLKQELFVIIFVNGVIAYCTGIFNPTRQALINEIIPVKEITSANALFGSTMAFIHMIGPFVGAWAFVHFSGVSEVLIFDLFTYFIGVLLLSKIHYFASKNSNNVNNDQSHFLKTIQQGLQYTSNRKDLVAIFAICLIAGLCVGTLIPLILPFTKEVLNKDDQFYGTLMACFGMGGIVGGITSHKVSTRFHLGKVIIASLLVEVTMMNLWIRVTNFYLSCFIFFIWGVMVFVRITTQKNYISKTVPTKFLTRIYALSDLSFITPNIIGGILVGIIGDYFTTLDILQVVAIAFVVLIILLSLISDLKSLIYGHIEQVKREEIQI